MSDSPLKARLPAGAVAALLAVQVFFGSLSVAGKIALGSLTPFQLAAIRVTSGALLFVAVERLFVRSPLPARRDLAKLAGLAVLGVVLNQLLFLTGLARTKAVDATVLVATIPIFTVLIAAAFRHERVGPRQLFGAGIAFAGVALLVGLAALEFSTSTLLGNVLVTANALSYSFFLVFSRPMLGRIRPLTLAMWTFVFGAAIIDLVALPDLIRLAPSAVSRPAWLALLYIVVFATFGAYGLNSWALVRVRSSVVAAFVYLQPLVAALLALPLLGETIAPRTIAAAALILAGVALVTLPRRERVRGG